MQTLTLQVRATGDAHGELQAVGRAVERLRDRYGERFLFSIVEEEGPPERGDLGVGLAAAGETAALSYRRGRKEAGTARKKRRSGRGGTGGTGAAPRSYRSPEEFEELFSKDLEKFLKGLPDDSMREDSGAGSPFPGLRAFGVEDADSFRGRERQVARALAILENNRAAGHAFLLIHGSAGAGKSSLMQAGLAPALNAADTGEDSGPWAGTHLRPCEDGASPLETLAGALAEALPDLEKLRDASGKDGAPRKPLPDGGPVWDRARLARMMGGKDTLAFAVAAVMAALDRMSAGKPARLLILVDRLEELFTAAPGTDEAYLEALAALAATRRIRVIATLRDDALPRLRESPGFAGLAGCESLSLEAPETEELDRIIREPVAAAGLTFEGDLAARILADTGKVATPLPLLQFALRGLYPRKRGKMLLCRAYEEIGGVEQAIPRRADAAWAGLPAETRTAAASAIFGRLIHPGPVPALRSVPRQRLDQAHPAAPACVEAFLAAGLLSAGNGGSPVSVAHEILFTRWPQLREWLEGRKKSPASAITDPLFRERRLRRISQAIAAGCAGLALAAVLSGLRERPVPASPRHAAEAPDLVPELADADFAAGASRLAAGVPEEALPFLISSLENNPRHRDAQALLLATLRSTGWHFPGGEIRHPLPIRELAFAGADTLHVSIGAPEDPGTIIRWNLESGAMDAVLKPETNGEIRILGVAPGGRRALIRRNGAAFLLDAADLKPIKRLPLAAAAVPECVAWSGEGALLAYPAEMAGGISWIIADAASGETIRQSDKIGALPIAARLDRKRLRAIHADGMLADVPLSPANPMRKGLPPDPERLAAAIMSPEGGEVLARRTAGGRIVRFRLHEGDTPGLLQVSPEDPGEKWPGASTLPEEQPWSRAFPPAWTDLAPASGGRASAIVKGTAADRSDAIRGRFLPGAPLAADSSVSAVAAAEALIATGTESGLVELHRQLPRLGFALETGPASGEDGWRLFKDLGEQGSVEIREGELRLRSGDDVRQVEKPADWEQVQDLALSTDGKRMVLAGADEFLLREVETGKTLAAPEPADGLERLAFLDESRRIAVACRTAVHIFDFESSNLVKIAEIPIAGVTGLYAPAGGKWFALSTPEAVLIHSKADFSRVAALPSAPGKIRCWAEDEGWLAGAKDHELELWSVESGRLIARLPLAGEPTAISFETRNGFRGLKVEGRSRGFIPLAKEDGLAAGEIAVLRDFCRGLGGMDFAGDTRRLRALSREERREALARDPGNLAALFPGAEPVILRETARALPYLKPEPAAWHPLWDKLAAEESADPLRLAELASAVGDRTWMREYLRGQIGNSDAELFRRWRGETRTAPTPDAREIDRLHRLAGDSREIRELKGASWQAVGKDAGREAALAKLDAAAEATRAAFETDPSPQNALARAEALALRGDAGGAADFLRGKIPGDAPLYPRQVHFLLSANLEAEASEAVERALANHGSPWLWRQWLRNRAADGGELSSALGRTLEAVDGRGPAAVEALKIALEEKDAALIAACLKGAKDLPASLRQYATGAALWAEEEKARAFALWPDEFPDLHEEASWKDWGGWEDALPERESLFAAMRKELREIEAEPGADIAVLQSTAALLLAPEATARYGVRRVRDAMVRTASRLAQDKDSRELVEQLVERARLAGAPHAECLRIEARTFMAAGEFTAAYARWIELIDSGEGIVSGDYLEAARCVIEDMQDAAAIALLMRGKERYPRDAAFAFDGAWLLLSTGHPEEAGVLLEHGFGIPFSKDQKEVALAMLVCAAEQTLRTEKADQAFAQLSALSAEWGSEESLKSLGWPEALEQTLLAVAERNR